jgi:hypothetical protein
MDTYISWLRENASDPNEMLLSSLVESRIMLEKIAEFKFPCNLESADDLQLDANIQSVEVQLLQNQNRNSTVLSNNGMYSANITVL